MRVKPDGFELTFTDAADPSTLADVASYSMSTYTYIYQSNYGSPEVDHGKCVIESATVGDDGRSVRLKVEGLRKGFIHELKLPGVRSKSGGKLLHDVAYYTLFYLP
jgi:hypothetical protein